MKRLAHRIGKVVGPYPLIAVTALFLSLYVQENSHNDGDDFAQYLLHARAIQDGASYSFLNEGNPGVLPGFPLLLAILLKIAGLNFFVLLTVLYVIFSLSVAYLFRPLVAGTVSLWLISISFGTLPQILLESTVLLPGLAFLALFNLLIGAMHRILILNPALAGRRRCIPHATSSFGKRLTTGESCYDRVQLWGLQSRVCTVNVSQRTNIHWIILILTAAVLALTRPESTFILLPCALLPLGRIIRIYFIILAAVPIALSRWLNHIGMPTYDGGILSFLKRTVEEYGFIELLFKLEQSTIQTFDAFVRSFGLSLPAADGWRWANSYLLVLGLFFVYVVANLAGYFLLRLRSRPGRVRLISKLFEPFDRDNAAQESATQHLLAAVAFIFINQFTLVVLKGAEIGSVPARYLLVNMAALVFITTALLVSTREGNHGIQSGNLHGLGQSSVKTRDMESSPALRVLVISLMLSFGILAFLRLPNIKHVDDPYFNDGSYIAVGQEIVTLSGGCEDLEISFYKPRNLTLRLHEFGLSNQVQRWPSPDGEGSGAFARVLVVFASTRYNQAYFDDVSVQQDLFRVEQFDRFTLYIEDVACTRRARL